MVGLIPKMLVDLVEESAGEEAVVRVLEIAGVPAGRRYRMDEAYDDVEWRRLLAATCQVLAITQDQAELILAEFFFEDSLKRWPKWFAMAANSRNFLERQPNIHNGFARGVRDLQVQDAINDKFNIESRPHDIVLHYRSPNELCGLYMALARRIIAHYDDDATIEERCCLKNGGDECEINIRWAA